VGGVERGATVTEWLTVALRESLSVIVSVTV
jgi:hypothetical protein